LVSGSKGGTCIEDVLEQGAEGDIRTEEELNYGRLRKVPNQELYNL
jgi:hypothetical protein